MFSLIKIQLSTKLSTENSSYCTLQELAQLEVLCKQLYETTDSSVRTEAEKTLVQFANSPDCLNKCQLLLERGNVSIHSITMLLLEKGNVSIHSITMLLLGRGNVSIHSIAMLLLGRDKVSIHSITMLLLERDNVSIHSFTVTNREVKCLHSITMLRTIREGQCRYS